MKRIFTLLSLALISISALAQDTIPKYRYFLSQEAKVLNLTGNDTLSMGLAGGMHAPQFNEVDLNQDNIMDLMIYDRLGGKITTFINKGGAGVNYEYAPQYEDLFPKVKNWVIMRDYDRDNKMDIFTSLNDRNIAVYRNVSDANGLKFELTYNVLRADKPETIVTWDSTTLYCFKVNYPAIEDIDGDGDLDMISYSSTGFNVEAYINRQEDASLPKTQFAFSHVDLCWGSFGENPDGSIRLGYCEGGFFPYRYYKKKHASGGTLNLFDVDGDGDLDLFHGTLDQGGRHFVENGKKDFSYGWDTLISTTDDFPIGQKSVDLYHFVNTFFIDVDNDGVKDMICTVNGTESVEETNQVWWYKNEGTNSSPDFKFKSENLLQADMVDLGGRTTPLFWDYDADGDQDLIVGSNGDFSISNNTADRLYLYENVGDSSKAIFKQINDDFLSLKAEGLSSISPALGDIDGDDKPDLLVGVADGTIRYYTNTTVGNTVSFSLQEKTLQSIDVGDMAAPFVVDLDKDGRLDLIVGTKGGNIHYYRNTGSKINPAFQKETDSLGYVRTNEYLANVNPPTYTEFGYATPVIADIDYDGTYELIVGGEEGKVRLFTNIDGNLTGKFKEVDSFLFNTSADTFLGSVRTGTMVYPTVADINADSMMDIIIGNARGGIMLWASNNTLGNIDNVRRIDDLAGFNLNVYPNPANNSITISRDRNHIDLKVTVTTTLGKTLISENFTKGNYQQKLDISNLAAGIYFVNFTAPSGATKTVKLSVLR